MLYVIDIFTNYAWVKSLNDKNRKTALNAFIEIVNEPNKKTNDFWLDQGKEFYNKVMQDWLDNNSILMYSTHKDL